MTYVSMVSCDSVHLDLLITELNDLYILAGDIQNTYLNALKKIKYFTMLVMNGNTTQGKVVIIVIYIYGLKYSTLERRNHLYEILDNHLGS